MDRGNAGVGLVWFGWAGWVLNCGFEVCGVVAVWLHTDGMAWGIGRFAALGRAAAAAMAAGVGGWDERTDGEGRMRRCLTWSWGKGVGDEVGGWNLGWVIY